MATIYKANDTGAASSIMSDKLPSNKVVVSDAEGNVASSEITSTELNALEGVTSNVQDQLDKVSNDIPSIHIEGKVLVIS